MFECFKNTSDKIKNSKMHFSPFCKKKDFCDASYVLVSDHDFTCVYFTSKQILEIQLVLLPIIVDLVIYWLIIIHVSVIDIFYKFILFLALV